MNCQESQDLLQRRFDDEAAGVSAGLDQHLATCPVCHDLHAAAGRLAHALALRRPAAPPGDLARVTVSRVIEAQRLRVRLRRRLRLGVAVAASLLLAAGAAYFQPWRGAQSVPHPAPDVARTHEAVPGPERRQARTRTQPDADAGPTLNESVQEAGSALVSLSKRTAREALGPGRQLLLPEVAPPRTGATPDVLAQAFQPPVRSLRQAGAGVSAGVEPVTRAAGRAVQAFFDEIPALQADKQPGL
jgi:hypothetical protein